LLLPFAKQRTIYLSLPSGQLHGENKEAATSTFLILSFCEADGKQERRKAATSYIRRQSRARLGRLFLKQPFSLAFTSMVLLSLLSYGLILWGTLWLLLELWIWRTRSKLRHRITGQPIPATPFFDLLWLLVRNSFGSQSDPIGTFVYARFAINHDN